MTKRAIDAVNRNLDLVKEEIANLSFDSIERLRALLAAFIRINGSIVIRNRKTNLSLNDVGGTILLVSQFTLYADCKKGNRPSFLRSGSPQRAEELYEYVIAKCREQGYGVETGSFGADMKVDLLNDGPFSVWMDSDELWSDKK